MSAASDKRSEEFLGISAQFKLGALVTESSHPVTAALSDVARRDIAQALDLLFQVDADVVRRYREFVESGRAGDIKEAVARALRKGGRMFFTGCGSTGRLSIQLVSIWRDFWQRFGAANAPAPAAQDWENRAFSVMAGGDFALIKSVEGFEDFAAFGRKQLGDLGVSGRDVVFAITEGGETSFVIGTALEAADAGAEVYFVYNNPDEILCAHIDRSREVIEDPRVTKLNLTTGPMAIAGSTRMQATTIQLCVLITVLEMVVCDLLAECAPAMRWGAGKVRIDSAEVPPRFLSALSGMHRTLRSPEVLSRLAWIVALEESVYRAGRRNNYYADRFGIDVLTDTTERSPTYCTPPFRKFDDTAAAESWSFLYVPDAETPAAWRRILKRAPACLDWTDREIGDLVGGERATAMTEIIRKVSCAELMRFRMGLDGLADRPPRPGDSAIGILSTREAQSLVDHDGFHRTRLEAARGAGAKVGLIAFGDAATLPNGEAFTSRAQSVPGKIPAPPDDLAAVLVGVPDTDLLLDGVTRVGVKMLLNALSTCTMVRLGRVMGNYMIWVVPSNLKLIDRATRYTQKLTGLAYEHANRLLFEAIEYVEPRMKSDQAYPPVVGLAVLRARHNLTNAEAERQLTTVQG